MKTFAIKGHPTRGGEVIQILEMLGGKKGILGGCNPNFIYYFKSGFKYILVEDINNCNLNDFKIFTFEEFLEKYPYKIGDLVNTQYYENTEIIKMAWDGNTIVYELHDLGLYTIDELQPYNKIIRKSECKNRYGDINTAYINLNHFYYDKLPEIELILPDNWKFKQKDGKVFGVRKQYPKTYEECRKILQTGCTIPSKPGYKEYQIALFQELLICRDAYWKIAGDWEEKRKKEINHYVIYFTLNGGLVKDCLPCTMVKHLLDFPTEEMRDAFYKNFKDLIEKCKEFL